MGKVQKNNVGKIMITSFAAVMMLLLILLILEKTTANIVLNGEDNIVLELGEAYNEEGYVAKTLRRDVSEYVKVDSDININKIGSYEVRYTLDIDFLNIHKRKIRRVEVKDLTPPELKIEGDKDIYLKVNGEVDYPLYTATDDIDGDLTNRVEIANNIDATKAGDYTITYKVSDNGGNVTTEIINVHVVEKKIARIDINITEQKLYYYEFDKLILTSDVVTGYNNATPPGNYSVLYKARNTYLTGSNYRSFVKYWIAFIGTSYGMHDASWRNKFGGTIYKTNGSHGCVNMPTDKVATLYDLVEVGTPVYIHK